MLIDIFHDTACPWCRIGKKHLFDAIALLDQNQTIEIRWHPFLLDDSIPAQGVGFRAFMKMRKGIGADQLTQLFSYATQSGAKAGVKLDFEKVFLAVNTTLSHRLIALTPKTHKNVIVEAVYKAYFEDGLNIGDVDTLASLGKEFGFDQKQLKQQLSSDAALAEVVEEAKAARNQGISSVPFFVINNKVSISGSQSVEVFIQAIQKEL
ncbi:DsbA family oxidoreductase [Chlorogloea sp. CCALA 695]|uniref:DsbA family oxidoreductase n=1 Tax=Chlorogloea sp. CCALA 695 TaxID=2107693 RepID=UPI000D07C4EF|nr:DsbA family oxidoreductase [Chlorogloea sp. CCALA 695]PSB31054.1 frnE protein [Chlorogloea sp. CCALA 695]